MGARGLGGRGLGPFPSGRKEKPFLSHPSPGFSFSPALGCPGVSKAIRVLCRESLGLPAGTFPGGSSFQFLALCPGAFLRDARGIFHFLLRSPLGWPAEPCSGGFFPAGPPAPLAVPLFFLVQVFSVCRAGFP